MRREPQSSEWQASNIEFLGRERSSRGVLEPEVAVLRDGRLLAVARASNTDTTPGAQVVSASSDDGGPPLLSPLDELRYDDGSRFYSPSSIHRFVRSERNGKLYWLANITPEPPDGNSPRYPLYIAEIDEDRVAVRRESLLLVDDRGPNEPEALQTLELQRARRPRDAGYRDLPHPPGRGRGPLLAGSRVPLPVLAAGLGEFWLGR